MIEFGQSVSELHHGHFAVVSSHLDFFSMPNPSNVTRWQFYGPVTARISADAGTSHCVALCCDAFHCMLLALPFASILAGTSAIAISSIPILQELNVEKSIRETMKTPLIAIAICAACSTVSFGQNESDIQLLPPIDAASTVIPIGEEVIVENTGPTWYSPTTWFDGPLWENSLELGINGSEGNAESFSILAGGKLKRESDASAFAMDISYGKTKSSGVETQNYALFNSRWDWKLNERSFLYNKNVIEFDKFKAFDLRLVLSGGLGHHLIKNDQTTLTGRFGAGASREFGGPDDDWVPEANFGMDFEHKISKHQKINGVMDYYPSWEDYADYRLVSKIDWELLLSEQANLSLKLGAIDRYDSTPNGTKANDIDYFVTLLWKL